MKKKKQKQKKTLRRSGLAIVNPAVHQYFPWHSWLNTGSSFQTRKMKLPKLFSSRRIQQLHEESIKRSIAKQVNLNNKHAKDESRWSGCFTWLWGATGGGRWTAKCCKNRVFAGKIGDRCGRRELSDTIGKCNSSEGITLYAFECVCEHVQRDKERVTERYQHVHSRSVGARTAHASQMCHSTCSTQALQSATPAAFSCFCVLGIVSVVSGST